MLYFLQTGFRGYPNQILSGIYISNNTSASLFEYMYICAYTYIYISYIYTYTSIYTQTHSHCYILNMWKICISGVCSGNMMTQFLLMTSLNSSMLRPLFVNKSYEALIFILICVIEVWIQQSYTFNFIIGFNIYWIVRCLSIYLFFYQECFNTMFSPFG